MYYTSQRLRARAAGAALDIIFHANDDSTGDGRGESALILRNAGNRGRRHATLVKVGARAGGDHRVDATGDILQKSKRLQHQSIPAAVAAMRRATRLLNSTLRH
jgi:hypothetical protein